MTFNQILHKQKLTCPLIGSLLENLFDEYKKITDEKHIEQPKQKFTSQQLSTIQELLNALSMTGNETRDPNILTTLICALYEQYEYHKCDAGKYAYVFRPRRPDGTPNHTVRPPRPKF